MKQRPSAAAPVVLSQGVQGGQRRGMGTWPCRPRPLRLQPGSECGRRAERAAAVCSVQTLSFITSAQRAPQLISVPKHDESKFSPGPLCWSRRTRHRCARAALVSGLLWDVGLPGALGRVGQSRAGVPAAWPVFSPKSESLEAAGVHLPERSKNITEEKKKTQALVRYITIQIGIFVGDLFSHFKKCNT